MKNAKISSGLLTLMFGVTALISLNTAQLANAALIANGGFETGDFTGWEVLRSSAAEVRQSILGIGPPGGNYFAYMGTATTILPRDSAIEDFLDLPIGTLDALSSGDARFGSAFRRVLDIKAGDPIAFDWDFATQSSFPGGNDFAFVAIDGVATLLADFTADFGPAPRDYWVHTGFSTFKDEFSTSGPVVLGFGVMDVDGGSYPSILLVDNVIPEPATALLLATGVLAAFGYAPRRRQRRGISVEKVQ